MSTQHDKTSKFSRRIADFVGYTTLGVTLLMLVFFLIIPVGFVLAKAFWHDGKFTLEYFGLLFANEDIVDSIVNSLKLGLATTCAATMVSLPLALINQRWDYRGKSLISALLLIPMIIPPFVAAIGIKRFFARMGSVNLFLLEHNFITEPIDWLGSEHMFWAVVVLATINLYPIMYLNLSAALANIDPSLEEVAATMGVSRWRRLKDIVWPLARPGFFAGATIVYIWALTDLGTPLLVGFHKTMPVKIFNMVYDANENPVGHALVVFVIVLTVSLFLLSKLSMGRKRFDMLAKGHVAGNEHRAGVLGHIAIYAVMFTVLGTAIIPHLSIFVTSFSDDWFMTILPESWTLEHYRRVFGTELSAVGIKNSLLLASASTMVDVVLGLLIAYVVVRKLIPFSNLLDSLVMVPLALPGIVLAFGYFVTYTGTFLDPQVNPIPLLIIAFAIRRLPFMVRSASAGLQQTSISLEEASISFGASRLYTVRKITIPLVSANLIAGGLLCFSYAMLDVSDSLILAMKDKFYPLTKAIYVLFLEQGTGELIASALGVIGMGILGSCIIGAGIILGEKFGELFRS
jgi:iron(III) transport system permease protein